MVIGCRGGLETPEAALLLAIINNHPPFRFENTDLDRFIKLIEMHSVAPFVFYHLIDHGQDISKNGYEALKSKYLDSTCSNIEFWNAFLKIEAAFKHEHVCLLPFKGMDILARFYPFFDQRLMVDIDVLIKEEDFAKAEHIFLGLGYRKSLEGLRQEYWQKHQCHIVFCKDGVSVDVHWDIDFKRNRRVLLPHLWDRVKTVIAGNHEINIFSAEDAFFGFALHWRRYGNVLMLKQVLDVARILKETPVFDWDYVLRESRRGKMRSVIYFILTQASLFCDAKIPETIMEKLKIPFYIKILTKKFLLKHTFNIRPSFKWNYLQAHFLLYDNPFEPFCYLINIPYEQFCKFYSLKTYTHKSRLIYHLRIPYMVLSLFDRIMKKIIGQSDSAAGFFFKGS